VPVHVSVILPTSGRARSLADTLTTIVRQTFASSAFEILVIENGPESGAREVTSRIGRENSGIALSYIHDATPGLLTGRHRGALEAHGDLLVFVDDDIDASPEWLAAMVEPFAGPDVHLVGGRNLPRFAVPPPAWVDGFWYSPPYGGRACTFLSLLDLGEEPLTVDANYVWGLNFGIRRRTLFRLGGFHPDSIPDHLQHFQGDGETGLTMKVNQAGLRASYQPKAVVHHRIPATRLTTEYFRRRAFYQGVCDSFAAIRREPGCLGTLGFAEGPEVRLDDASIGGAAQKRARGTSEPTFEDVEQEVRAAHEAGYAFHQEAVRRHPRLLEWVLRESYWDYRLPDLGRDVMLPPRACDPGWQDESKPQGIG
jgi:glucosyl-dolichyl phosphate glucuronosyltransferase